MYASTEQVAAQKRRTARSHRFLIRLGILCAAFAAAVLAGTAAAQADEQNAAPEVVQGESAAIAQLPDDMPPPDGMPAADDAEPGPVPNPEPSPVPSTEPSTEPGPEDGGIIEDEGGKPLPPKQPSPIDLTDLPGTVAAATEIVAETTELVEEVPAASVSEPVVGVVAHAARGVAATSDTVLSGAEVGGSDLVAISLHVVSQAVASGGLPEDGAGTEVPAPQGPTPQAPAPQTPAPQTPGHQNSVEPFVLSAVGEFERARRHVAPLPSEMSLPAAARTSAGSGAADMRSESDAAAPVEAPAAISSDLGGGIPLSELLGGDHGVVSGGGGAGVAADRAAPDSTCYGDGAGLVSDPVRTDAQPHSEPVARPGFAPD